MGLAPTSWWISRGYAYRFMLIPIAICVMALVGAPGAIAVKFIASGLEFGEYAQFFAATIGWFAAMLVAFWFYGWWFRHHPLY
jgi:hypothetical protein